MPCGCSLVGRGRSTSMFSSVSGASLKKVAIGSCGHHRDGNTPGLGEQAALCSLFGSVGGVWPCFFPLPKGLWSSLRPSKASSSRRLGVRRRRAAHKSRTAQRRQPPPTPGSVGEPRSDCRCRSHPALPTGSRCEARKEWHSSHRDPAPEDYGSQEDVVFPVAAIASFPPRVRRGCAIHRL